MGNMIIYTKPSQHYSILLLVFSFLLLSVGSYATPFQGIKITGIVLEQKLNAPLVGVTVVEKGTSNGTVTDFDGKFTLTVTNTNASLEFFIHRF